MKVLTTVLASLFFACILFSFSGAYCAHLNIPIVYIRSDGSINPPISELYSSDNITYCLTGNLTGCVVIERNDVVFDGSGFTIFGEGSGNGIELSGRKNVTIENIMITGFYQGILIYNFSTDNTVSSIKTIENSYGGICVDSSTNNNITGNMLLNDADQGITLSGSADSNLVSGNILEGNQFEAINLISCASGNFIEKNNISDCFWDGIHLWMSSCNNTIYGNNVTKCGLGIEVSYSSNNNTIHHNSFSMNSKAGVAIGYRIPESVPEQGGVADNCFMANNVTGNNVGIYLIYSKNNTILHNNIVGNNVTIIVDGSYPNIWDDGSKGNFWSDYNGTDSNSSGVGDTPYVIDSNNIDNRPLMRIFDTSEPTIPEFSLLTLLLSTVIFSVKALLTQTNKRNCKPIGHAHHT
jgi:parallel beta-helix repeat protein